MELNKKYTLEELDCGKDIKIMMKDFIIENNMLVRCNNNNNNTIPNNIMGIYGGCFNFYGYTNLKSKVANYKACYLENGKLVCDDGNKLSEYKINEWTKEVNDINIDIYEKGYHYFTNLFDVFNYYWGKFDKDIIIFECEVGDKIIINDEDSRCCTNKIKLVKRLTKEEIINLLNV